MWQANTRAGSMAGQGIIPSLTWQCDSRDKCFSKYQVTCAIRSDTTKREGGDIKKQSKHSRDADQDVAKVLSTLRLALGTNVPTVRAPPLLMRLSLLVTSANPYIEKVMEEYA